MYASYPESGVHTPSLPTGLSQVMNHHQVAQAAGKANPLMRSRAHAIKGMRPSAENAAEYAIDGLREFIAADPAPAKEIMQPAVTPSHNMAILQAACGRGTMICVDILIVTSSAVSGMLDGKGRRARMLPPVASRPNVDTGWLRMSFCMVMVWGEANLLRAGAPYMRFKEEPGRGWQKVSCAALKFRKPDLFEPDLESFCMWRSSR